MNDIDRDTLRPAAYARQSKNKDASIQDQIIEARLRFEEEGWPEPLIFKEGRGASRHSRGSRDEWPKVVELMETGQVNLLWLWEQSRGNRKASEWLRLLETCRELRVLVYIEDLTRLFDPADDKDWEDLAKQAVQDEAESNKIARRTQRAKRLGRASGDLRRVLGGQPPIGYRDSEDGWETDPAHADMLRELATAMLPPFKQTLAEAFGTWTLANGPAYFNLPGNGQGRRITAKDLHRALRLPVTAALMTEAPVKNGHGEWVRRGRIIRQAEVPGGPPLDPETWERLQRMFAESSAGRAPAEEYPHGKILACWYCGNQLSGKIHYGQRKAGPKLIPTYTCTNPHKVPGSNPPRFIKPCRKVTVPAAEVNEILRLAVASWWMEHADEFGPADAASALDAELAGRRATLIARRDHVVNQRSVFLRKFRADAFSEEEYDEVDAGAAEELAQVRAELKELEAAVERARDEEVAAHDGRLPPEIEHWDDLSPQEQQRWVRKAFVTPIKVIKAYGTGRKLATDERMMLIPRDLS